MCVWIFYDYLAEHMAKDEQGAAAVCVLTDRVLQQGTLEPPMLAGHVAAMAIWRGIYFALSALGAFVQREAVTPQQMESLPQCNFDKPTCPGEKVLAKLLRRAWWAERVKGPWRRGSTEAVAQPRLARIAETLRRPTAADRDADEVWTLAEGSMATWQKTLRGESLQDVLGAMLEYMVAQSRQLHSDAISSEHTPRLEKLRSRTRWLDDTAGMTLLGKDIKELSALIQRTRARTKVSPG